MMLLVERQPFTEEAKCEAQAVMADQDFIIGDRSRPANPLAAKESLFRSYTES